MIYLTELFDNDTSYRYVTWYIVALCHELGILKESESDELWGQWLQASLHPPQKPSTPTVPNTGCPAYDTLDWA